MSDLETCPDCGQGYKTLEEYYAPPPGVEPTSREVPEIDVRAEAHRDFECPVQREREQVEALLQALRYFGAAGTLAKLSDLIREHEHDAEVIWGDAERWFAREREECAGRPVCCPVCGVQLGEVRGGQFRFGVASVVIADLGGSEEVRCQRCDVAVVLKDALTRPEGTDQPEAGEHWPRTLRLVEPHTEEE